MATSNPKYIGIVKNDFDILSKSYDLINNFMSLGTDRQFRYLAIKYLLAGREKDRRNLNFWVDIGTGTGHLANELYKQKNDSFVLGIDITRSMLEYCKDREVYQKGYMSLVLADAGKTPFRSNSIDGSFSGFVGRHFTNYPKTLSEHNRIIRFKGRYGMLEMGRRATRISFLIDIYVGQMMSILGRLASFIVTKGNAPFRLLEDTYEKFYSPMELKKLFSDAGFHSKYKLGLMGSIVIMLGLKV